MAFWILNKETNAPDVCGSVIAVTELTGLNKDTLYKCFSRQKKIEYNTPTWRICKVTSRSALGKINTSDTAKTGKKPQSAIKYP